MALKTLRKPWQFRHTYRVGKKVTSRFAILFYHHSGEPDDGPRFGFVASKKVGGAVNRNRAKRLLREAVAAAADRLTARDLWIVLVARSSIVECRYEDVATELDKIMMSEGLLENRSRT